MFFWHMLNSFEGHLLEKTVRMHTKLLAGMGFEISNCPKINAVFTELIESKLYFCHS